MTSRVVIQNGDGATTRLIRRQWITRDTFVLGLERPPVFRFMPGQRIQLRVADTARDYSLIPGDSPDELALLIRSVAGGSATAFLGRCPLGTRLPFTGPSGHFIYRSTSRTPVFIATGTGIAPFAAMCREGVRAFALLHGVRHAGELYFRDLLEAAADRYVPCLTGQTPPLPKSAFAGRVTLYLQQRLPPGDYDFYLAGRRKMIAEVIAIVDERFPSSRVYSEIFF